MKQTSHNDVMIEVKKCPRCHLTHRIHFKPFLKQEASFTHWGMCSNSNEPVVMLFKELLGACVT